MHLIHCNIQAHFATERITYFADICPSNSLLYATQNAFIVFTNPHHQTPSYDVVFSTSL
jgi:hypothetical protein